MKIAAKIMDEEESWAHQLSVYQGYHQKYAKFYPAENFFYHPYLLENFSKPNLSAEVLGFDDHNQVGDKSIDKFLSKENLENNYAQTLKDIQFHYQRQQILQQGKDAEK